ncbi:MAG: hypothetical protein J6T56_06635 [Bacteroidales bacterium]|nr:hypothetical protein [Bacteroidales bacterium]MBP5395707.1 hypothetical protein [Bacteroidales bacterium]
MRNKPQFAIEGDSLRKHLRKNFGLRVPQHALPVFETVWRLKPQSEKKLEDNERLAYIGEKILDSVISVFLFEKYPCIEASALDDIQRRITHHARLSRMAQRLQIDYHPSASDEESLLLRDYINSDILKALIGAIGLVKGYDCAKKQIMKQLMQQQQVIREIGTNNTNYKGKILAWGQRNKSEIRFKPTKEIKYRGRILHIVSLYINNEWAANGCDTLVKNAEQHASLNALDGLNIQNDFSIS